MTQDTPQVLPRTIGMDLGAGKSAFCILTPDGKRREEGELPTRQLEMQTFFAFQPPSRVVIEASGPSRWVAEVATSCGHEVVVANPREFRLIAESHRKTDRNDARILADFGQIRPSLLHPVQLRGLKCQIARTLLSARSLLVSQRTRLINVIRANVRNLGQPLPTGSAACFHRKAKELIPTELQPSLSPLMEILESLGKAIATYDKEIERTCKEDFPETSILLQVPSVGPNTALCFIATIEDPHRFRSSRDVGAYVGLVAMQRSSGSKNPQLRISKRGDKLLRRLLVNSASHVMGGKAIDSDLKRYGERMKGRGGQAAAGKARIAVARKIAILLHRLLITGEVYEPLRNSQVA